MDDREIDEMMRDAILRGVADVLFIVCLSTAACLLVLLLPWLWMVLHA
jgi:hypothetical protein